MKKYISLLLILLLLASCGDPAPTSPPPTELPVAVTDPPVVFNAANYPRVACAATGLPLAEALAASLLDLPRGQTGEFLHYAGSTQAAYSELIAQRCDLILAHQYDETTEAEANAVGVAFELFPIAHDALVFINDIQNPVANIFHDQLLSVYTGEIKNWQTLGGADGNIRAYRQGRSATQTLWQTLLMRDEEAAAPPMQYWTDPNGETQAALANYNYTAAALGYTTYTTVSLLQPSMLQRCKLVAIDGVEPNPQTIADRSYRYGATLYAVVRADAPGDDPARVIAQWLTTQGGQDFIQREQYISIGW